MPAAAKRWSSTWLAQCDQALVKTRLYGRALPKLAAAALQYRAAQAQGGINQCKMA